LLQVNACRGLCSTDFGTMLFGLRSVVDSKGALQCAALADGWSRVSEGSSKAKDIHTSDLRATNSGLSTFNFFEDAEQVLRIVRLVMDIIHIIEAEKSLLSGRKHVRSGWLQVVHCSCSRTSGREKHVQHSCYAAFLP
jgi:hypothetical protein